MTLHILRDGKEMQLDVMLGMRPDASQQQADSSNGTMQLLPASKAIAVAKKAVEDAGLMSAIDSTNAHRGTVSGQPVWIIKLSGNGKNASVTIDAQTGEVVDLLVQK